MSEWWRIETHRGREVSERRVYRMPGRLLLHQDVWPNYLSEPIWSPLVVPWPDRVEYVVRKRRWAKRRAEAETGEREP